MVPAYSCVVASSPLGAALIPTVTDLLPAEKSHPSSLVGGAPVGGCVVGSYAWWVPIMVCHLWRWACASAMVALELSSFSGSGLVAAGTVYRRLAGFCLFSRAQMECIWILSFPVGHNGHVNSNCCWGCSIAHSYMYVCLSSSAHMRSVSDRGVSLLAVSSISSMRFQYIHPVVIWMGRGVLRFSGLPRFVAGWAENEGLGVWSALDWM